jgi:hypothetical protein
VDPNHDADIRIGSEAPKQRVPNLDGGMKAMGSCEQPATSDRFFGGSSPISAGSPKLRVFAFFYCMYRSVDYAADLNRKPSGTRPVFAYRQSDDQFSRERHNHRLA